MPERIQLSRRKGWRKPVGAISVSRPYRWGNPFPVSIYGLDLSLKLFANSLRGIWSPSALDQAQPDWYWDETYERHTSWLKRLGGHPTELARVELAGKDLACWCRLTDRCHADLLLAVANRDAS